MAIELNKSQKDAVYYFGEKPLLIEAGPGSGKTRVIIERVKFLINDKNLDPSSFLIITFTRKAARELRERLKRKGIDEDKINKMQISTIHSFCYELLKNNLDENIQVLDDDFNSKKSMFIYKNRYRLGFRKYKKLKRSSISRVLDLFNEFSTFGITDENLDELTKYIEANFPVSDGYKNFVKEEIAKTGKFPEKKIKEYKKLKNEDNDPVITELKNYKKYWDNSILCQIPQAYKEYLCLLKEENYLDYGILQKEALDYLKENPETNYKNILIDEFQDTDPIQNEIFKILLKEIVDENKKDLENIKSTFTVVGDIDQSIYRFRGAYEDYFKELSSLDFTEAKKEFLDTNYRSTLEIVDFCDNYIIHQRDRPNLKPNEKKPKSSNIYFIENDDRDGEAEDLIKIIKKLKAEGIIEKYNEIAILFRSVLNDSKELTKKLDENSIPYQVSDVKGLENRDEISFILDLMEYITFSNDREIPFIYNKKLPWLKLVEYSNDSKATFHFSDETKESLQEYHKEFEKEVVKVGKEEYLELYGEKCTRRALSGILDEDDELLEKVFKRVKVPVLDYEELEKKIRNEKDLKFFKELNKLKDTIFELRTQKVEIKDDLDENENKEIKKCDSLKIFYKLLEIADYLDYDFIIDKENKGIIENLGLISSIIIDYENIYHEKEREITEHVINEETGELEKLRFKVPIINIFGLHWFLNSMIRNISISKPCESGVNLMTVHKAKGLEFPVVIVAGLNDNHFPKDYKYLAKRSNETYFTPNRFLDYKNETDDEELLNHNNEEERVIYVAMTRAEDFLILSKHHRPKKNDILTVMESEIAELNDLSNLMDNLDGMESLEILDKETGELGPIYSLISQIKEMGSNEIKESIDEEIKSVKNNLEITKAHKNRLNDLIENKDYVEIVDKDDIENISFKIEKEDDGSEDGNEDDDKNREPLYLSHSSISNYERCAFAYNLSYNFKIKPSPNTGMEYGTVNHNVLENINNMVIKDKNTLITKKIIEEEVKKESKDFAFDDETLKDIVENIVTYWEEKGSKIEVLESEYKFKVLKNKTSDENAEINYTLNGSIDLIYKENNDLYILDYKTGQIDEKFKHTYANQLYTYALALKSDPDYMYEEIKGLQIYSINNNETITIDFNDEKLKIRENEIWDVAENIINNEFGKRKYDGGEIPPECNFCQYKFICLKDID